MGNWFSGISAAASDVAKESAIGASNASIETLAPNVAQSDDIEHAAPELMTRDDLIHRHGVPAWIGSPKSAFIAYSLDEDSFLIGGGRDTTTERLVWKRGARYIVAYLNDKHLVTIFY